MATFVWDFLLLDELVLSHNIILILIEYFLVGLERDLSVQEPQLGVLVYLRYYHGNRTSAPTSVTRNQAENILKEHVVWRFLPRGGLYITADRGRCYNDSTYEARL